MKSYYTLIFALCFNSFLFSQLGIQTAEPQGIFHVDAAHNNTPTIQENDDFIVKNTTGNVGVGTLNPSTKLHINGKITLTDGTQGNQKILVSRSNGQANWVLPALLRPNILGTAPTPTSVSSGQTGQTSRKYNYSGFSITLSQGKWIVSSGLTFDNIGGTSPTTGPRISYWMRTYLSTDPTNYTTLVQNNFTHLGTAGSDTAYGGLLLSGTLNPPRLGFISGSSVIEVTAPTQTIYLMMDQKPAGYYGYNSTYYENYFYATPID